METLIPALTLLIGGGIGFWLALKFATAKTPPIDASIHARMAEEKERLRTLEQEIRDYTAKVASLDTEKAALNERLREQQGYAAQVQEEFQLRFEALAHKIFQEKNEESKKHLHEILHPLKKDLTGFKEHIDKSFGEQHKEQFALKREIENIVRVSSEMKFQTESLSKALRGDVKAQGNWGEIILERILEASGLRKGEEYVPQAAGMGLKHPEDGRTQKPDMIIKLPEGKHAIIDAKVSLTAYERFCAEEDDAAKTLHLTQYLQSIKAHVKGLEERRYQDTAGLDTPEYVLMFMPIEGAYALAMQMDQDLHAHAWERKIIIVCPSTLFAILKIISSMWKIERQNKNAHEIARRGGLLYDKVEGFARDMLAMGRALDQAQGAYSGALDKLSKGRGNVLSQIEDLKKLGAKASKALPETLLEETNDTILELPKDAA